MRIGSKAQLFAAMALLALGLVPWARAQVPGQPSAASSVGCTAATTATASTCVKRNANANAFSNNILGNATSTVSAGGTTVLTAASAKYQVLTGSSSQTYQLPDATTLSLGPWFVFNNNSSGSLVINNAGSSAIYTVPAGGVVQCGPTSIATSNGTWDCHGYFPSTVTWGSGTTGLVFNTALSTTPAINAGAASSTNPVFRPQRGTTNVGYSGDSTHLYGVVGGAAAWTLTATGATLSGVSQQNTFTATGNGQQNTINFNTNDSGGAANNWQIGTGITENSVFQLYYPGLGNVLHLTNTGGVYADNAATSAATQTGYWCYDANKQLIADSTACLTSSRRFKEQIASIAPRDALAEVLRLRPVSFRYKPSFNGALESNPNFNGQQVGFIAEEVAQTDKRLIQWDEQTGTGKTPHGVRYENAVALLAGAIQAQQAEIKALRQELRAMRKAR